MKRFISIVFGIALLFSTCLADTLRISVIYDGEIKDDDTAAQTIKVLRSAEAGTEVYIYMTSPGGDVDTGIKIANAMKNSRAKVVLVVTQYAYSMAASLVCLAPNYEVRREAVLMYHMAYRPGPNGEIIPIDPKSPNDEYYYRYMNYVYKKCGFITKQEINRMNHGGELWITGDEVRHRMGK